jgi:hypothetical protein
MSVSEIVAHLAADPDWEQPVTHPDTAHWAVKSLTDWQTHDSVLQDICWQLDSACVKQQILDLASRDQIFQEFWSFPNRSCLDSITNTYAYFIQTPAHYENHPWHVDCKNLLLQGMIYLVEQPSNDQGTWFCRDTSVLYNRHDPETELRLPAAPWQGWLLINSDLSYHRALNLTEQPRFSIKFGLQFNLKRPHPRIPATHSI